MQGHSHTPQHPSPYHQSKVQEAPKTTPIVTLSRPAKCSIPTSHLTAAALAIAGNVVANCAVGFGPPLTATVDTLVFAEGAGEVGVLDAARIVKRGEVAYRTPIVELMKMRK